METVTPPPGNDETTDPSPEQIEQRIRDAAADLIARRGMRWRVIDAADQAGVSRGVIYRTFINRADLMSAVLGATVTDRDLVVLNSTRFVSDWQPTSVQDWADVHAFLCRGNRPT